jgi:hypothetical protein
MYIYLSMRIYVCIWIFYIHICIQEIEDEKLKEFTYTPENIEEQKQMTLLQVSCYLNLAGKDKWLLMLIWKGMHWNLARYTYIYIYVYICICIYIYIYICMLGNRRKSFYYKFPVIWFWLVSVHDCWFMYIYVYLYA